jgi:hypothetical protein
MGIHQHNFSLLAVQNASLKARLHEVEADLNSLVKTRNRSANIGLVKVNLENEKGKPSLDELSANELRKRVDDDFQVAVGKPVSAVKAAPQVFFRLADGKVYHSVREKDYLVRVRTVLVTQAEMTVWVTAEGYVKP